MDSTKQPSGTVSGSLPFPEYFSALAANYARQTGNSTRSVFSASFDDFVKLLPVTKDSVIHDNAAGPGTATSVIVDRFGAGVELPKIFVSDNVPAMVSAAKDTFAAWPNITTKVLDSLNLEGIPDDHFTHSILNFSVFTFADPLKGLQEIYRTLQPGGAAALLVWKHFGAGAVIHAAQASVRPDLPRMKIPHPEFMNEGVLANLAAEAGFASSSLGVSQRNTIVSGADLDGLRGFMLGDFTRPARAGWSEEEQARWPDAVEKAVQEEVNEFGGVRFEAWVVLAKK
ncbi:Fc.00g070880.m01.CDS01 [Cosmosporella sp. VM-42]